MHTWQFNLLVNCVHHYNVMYRIFVIDTTITENVNLSAQKTLTFPQMSVSFQLTIHSMTQYVCVHISIAKIFRHFFIFLENLSLY